MTKANAFRILLCRSANMVFMPHLQKNRHYVITTGRVKAISWILPRKPYETLSSVFPIPTKSCGHGYLRPCCYVNIDITIIR